MKYLIQIIMVMVVITNNHCNAQLMKVISDAKKIEENKQLFINKPLKTLLEEIQPPIKMVIANPGSNERLGYFVFRFVTYKQYDSIRIKNKYAFQIRVFIKESFEWNIQQRPKGNQFVWTKEDKSKYGDLKVVDVSVFGEE